MSSIEAEGDTIDEAIASALHMLQVSRDRVEIEILADATRGLFGFGNKKARVRATLRRPLADALSDPSPVSRETPEEAPRGSGMGAERPVARQAGPRRDPSPPARPRERPILPPDGQEIASRARSVLTDILGLLGVSASIEAGGGADPGSVRLDVTGEHGGLLIGRRGQTLDALEYLVNRMVSRDDGHGPGRITIDVERYRDRRCEYLESLAQRLAQKAVQTGRTVTLNPMSPRDRRIVHLALQGSATVVTRSQGEGHFRRVLIMPAGGARRRPGPERAEG